LKDPDRKRAMGFIMTFITIVRGDFNEVQ